MNPYRAPRAELDAPQPALMPANLENAVEGRYAFTIGDVMDEAWRLVKGMKGPFWGAAIVIGLIYLASDTIFSLILGMFLSDEPGAIVKQTYNAVVGAVMTPVTMGMSMMCVRRALGAPVSFSTAFSYYARAGTALAGALLVLLMSALGLLCLLLPAIYLSVAYQFTIQLICDQKLPAWKAMEISRKAITHRWWSVFGLGLAVGLLTGASALGLLIPLIWTIPWAMMSMAVLYRRIFYATPPAGPPPAGPSTPAAPTVPA